MGVAEMRERKMKGMGLPSPQVSEPLANIGISDHWFSLPLLVPAVIASISRLINDFPLRLDYRTA